MNTCLKIRVYFSLLLNQTLGAGVWSASRSDRFTPDGTGSGFHRTRGRGDRGAGGHDFRSLWQLNSDSWIFETVTYTVQPDELPGSLSVL